MTWTIQEKALTMGTEHATAAGSRILSLLVVSLLVLFPARDATAWRNDQHEPGSNSTFWNDEGWRDWVFYWYSIEREKISAKEEQRREAGRERRRTELEQQRKEDAAAHNAYFDAVMEASRFASRAPQGLYYRKPGFVVSEQPPGAERVQVQGFNFLYDRGVFFIEMYPRYVVVTAPVGAIVSTLPDGVSQIGTSAGLVYYYFGTFFTEKDGKFVVVKPPAGILVGYLPDGYTEAQAGGNTYYRFNDIYFKPYFIFGILTFMVVDI